MARTTSQPHGPNDVQATSPRSPSSSATEPKGQGSGARIYERMRGQKPLLAVIIVLMVMWEISTLFLPDIIAPSLVRIGGEVRNIVTDWGQLRHLAFTAVRVLVALALSFIGGLLLGIAMGVFARFREYAKSLLHLLQGVPALSWVVFAVIWFGNMEMRILFILTVVTLPQFALYTEGAVRDVDKKLLDVAHAFRATRRQKFRMIVLPAIVPAVVGAWVVNLGNGIRIAMVAELVGATSGVGFRLLQTQSVYNMAGAIAWTLLLVAYLLLLQGALSMIENRLLHWRQKEA